MDADTAATEFADLFGRAYRRFYRRVPVGDHRLTSESIAALQHLVEAGPLTIAEAATHLERSQSAMSEMIDRLERRGLVARVADQRDRRRTLVWLTPEGLAALEQAQQVLSGQRLREAFTAMKSDEREQLITALRHLVEQPRQRQSQSGVLDDQATQL